MDYIINEFSNIINTTTCDFYTSRSFFQSEEEDLEFSIVSVSNKGTVMDKKMSLVNITKILEQLVACSHFVNHIPNGDIYLTFTLNDDRFGDYNFPVGIPSISILFNGNLSMLFDLLCDELLIKNKTLRSMDFLIVYDFNKFNRFSDEVSSTDYNTFNFFRMGECSITNEVYNDYYRNIALVYCLNQTDMGEKMMKFESPDKNFFFYCSKSQIIEYYSKISKFDFIDFACSSIGAICDKCVMKSYEQGVLDWCGTHNEDEDEKLYWCEYRLDILYKNKKLFNSLKSWFEEVENDIFFSKNDGDDSSSYDPEQDSGYESEDDYTIESDDSFGDSYG